MSANALQGISPTLTPHSAPALQNWTSWPYSAGIRNATAVTQQAQATDMHTLMNPIINAMKDERATVMEIKHMKIMHKVETVRNANLQLERDIIDAQTALAKVNADHDVKLAEIVYQQKKMEIMSQKSESGISGMLTSFICCEKRCRHGEFS